jgi:CHAD domain-containing protein
MEESLTQITDIFATYRVDLSHARQVADLALALFDAVAERYELPAAGRRLLEVGALLHNVGITTDPPLHHLVGRDIVLRHVIDDLSQRDQAIVACMVAFHRKKVRPQLEPAFLGLGKKGQAEALQLSAILRVADGLDYSHSQTTCLLGLEPGEVGLSLMLEGPHAVADGAQAVAKADLWRKVFGADLLGPNAESDPSLSPSAEKEQGGEGQKEPLLPLWYAAPDAPLAELGRVLLRRHLRRMLAAERDVRADREIEDIHALRVATRRLRATLRLLAPVAPAAEARPAEKAIRRVARAAGAVRDRDVLLAHLAESRAELPEALHAGLDRLIATLGSERAKAYSRLIDLLDSDGHATFKAAFASLMNSSAKWDEGPRVRDLAGSTIWRHYEALRAHDRAGALPEGAELHAMRIDAKKLRYVLELFAESFGERAEQAVAQLAAFQDELGALNDTMVARATLDAADLGGDARAASDAYLALRESQSKALFGSLGGRWEKVASSTYRRKLMELIIRL